MEGKSKKVASVTETQEANDTKSQLCHKKTKFFTVI